MLMLLDSAGLYYRAFHGVPESITGPDGTPVNAVRGFLDMCTALVASRAPSGLVACWDDDWRPQWRVDLLDSYKAHRVAADGTEDEPEALGVQVGIIADVLATMGIARVGAAQFRGRRRHRHPRPTARCLGEPVEVVTGDRDLIQLVDDASGIVVLYTGRGIRRVELLDEAAVVAAHGVRPQQYTDMAILRGDPSDGLPGVPGIGAKTAASLLERFGDMDGILAAVGTDGGGLSPRSPLRWTPIATTCCGPNEWSEPPMCPCQRCPWQCPRDRPIRMPSTRFPPGGASAHPSSGSPMPLAHQRRALAPDCGPVPEGSVPDGPGHVKVDGARPTPARARRVCRAQVHGLR